MYAPAATVHRQPTNENRKRKVYATWHHNRTSWDNGSPGHPVMTPVVTKATTMRQLSQALSPDLQCAGDVMSALANKQSHIPFRNSKLTQLLQDSLCGQAKAMMFVHIAPEVSSHTQRNLQICGCRTTWHPATSPSPEQLQYTVSHQLDLHLIHVSCGWLLSGLYVMCCLLVNSRYKFRICRHIF